MAARPAVVNQFLDSEEDGESDADSSEAEEAKDDVANNDAVVGNDDDDSTSSEGESEEAVSDSSSLSAPEDVAEDDNAPSVMGEDEIGDEESDSSSSLMEGNLLDDHLKKLERQEKGATSPAPAEEKLPKTSSGEAGEKQAATSEVPQDAESESKHAASSTVAPVEVTTPKSDQIEKNDDKHMNIIQKEGTTPPEHDETEIVQGGLENQSQKEDATKEKPKELTKAERKALREKLYRKKECDIIDVNTTVYVGNFPRKCSTKDIKKFFSLCGEIEEVVHPKDKIEGKWVPLGWAFVRFKTSEAAKLARMGTGAKVHGRRITIQKRKKPAERIPLRGGKSVFVKYISRKATEEDLAEHFSQVGEVTAVRLLKSKKGRSLGIAFVDFEEMDGAYRAIEELDSELFMDQQLGVNSAFGRKRQPPMSCKSVRLKFLPMGTRRDDVGKLIKKKVGLNYVRMGSSFKTCVVDLVTHSQMLALLQMPLTMGRTKLRVKIAPNEGARYVNPVLARRKPVVVLEPVSPRITEEELLKELKTQLTGINYVVPGIESNKAYVIFEQSTSIRAALEKKVVKIRGREANITKWQLPGETTRDVVPEGKKVFGCRINKLPKKLSKKRFLALAEKLIGKRQFSLIWELNPKRKKFSGTVELIFEQLEDARFVKEAFEEFIVPGTYTSLKVFISERQSDGLWTKKIEDLYEIRGLPRPTEETKKRSLEEAEESSSKRVKQDSKKRLLQEGEEAPAAKRAKQEETKDRPETSNSEGKKDLSESWPEKESSEKLVNDEHSLTITEQEPEKVSAEKQVQDEHAKMLPELKPSGIQGKELPEGADVKEK